MIQHHAHYRMGDDWDDGAGRIADAILADKILAIRAERDSWEAQFHSAAAAASEYSEFWEKHHSDFDPFGNYLPYSQMDGDLRAAKQRIAELEAKSVVVFRKRQGKEHTMERAGFQIRCHYFFWDWPEEGMRWFGWAWRPIGSRWTIWRIGPLNYHRADQH